VRRERFDFTFIGLPHGNDASCATSRRPDNDYDSLIEPAGSNEALLTVVTPIVYSRQMYTLEHHFGPLKIQPAFRKGLGALSPVEGDQHDLL
jgi:hypothetical protein